MHCITMLISACAAYIKAVLAQQQRGWMQESWQREEGCMLGHAGYVAFKDFNLPIAAGLVALDTFAPHILQAASLCTILSNSKSIITPSHGPSCHNLFWVLMVSFSHNLRAFATVLCASMHRRHLLIWAVFAPKFVFEMCFSLVAHLAIIGASWVGCF